MPRRSVRVDRARNRETEFDLLVLDAVPADQGYTRLGKNFHRASHHLVHDLPVVGFGGEGKDAQRRQGFPAHRVDIADAIGRADAPEPVGIVHAGRHHVDGLDDTRAVGEAIDARIVRGGHAAEHSGIVHDR